MIAINNIEVFLLAGGKSTRMGEDKGTMLFQGKPMLQHIIDAIVPLEVDVNILTSSQDYLSFGLPLVPDLQLNCGPLGGLQSALTASNKSHILLLPCDIPWIQTETLKHFLTNTEAESINVPLIQKKIQPLPGIFPKWVLPHVENALQANEFALRTLIHSVAHHFIKMDEYESDFRNINSPNDFYL